MATKRKPRQRKSRNWRSESPTQSQQQILARYGMTAYSRGDAFDKINRLARNNWQPPTPAAFVPTNFPAPTMAKEEPSDDAVRRGIL